MHKTNFLKKYQNLSGRKKTIRLKRATRELKNIYINKCYIGFVSKKPSILETHFDTIITNLIKEKNIKLPFIIIFYYSNADHVYTEWYRNLNTIPVFSFNDNLDKQIKIMKQYWNISK